MASRRLGASAVASLKFGIVWPGLLLALPAFAQVDLDPANRHKSGGLETGSESEIVVTGTLLRGIAPAGTNVTGITRENVQASGASTMAQLLQSIPQLASFNSLQIPIAGFNLATSNRPNLRNLPGNSFSGSSTTLVLVDGHRIVGMGVQSTSPDIDILPPGLIERVEIVPDGGSSIYGSDAVGGVLNYITRKNFDGLELDARFGFAADYRTFDASATTGRNWATGSAFVSYNYSQHDAIYGRDRDFVRQFPVSLAGIPFPVTDLRCSPGNVQLVPAGTVHALPFASGAAMRDSANQCDASDAASIYPSEYRHSVMAGLSQELGDTAKLDLRGYFMNRWAYQSQGPFLSTQFLGPAAFGFTPSPFMAAHKLTTSPAEIQQISFAWGGDEANNANVTLETWGIAPGLTAGLGAGWQLRALASYGESTTRSRTRAVNGNALPNAIRAGLFNPYDPEASDPAALAAVGNLETFGLARQRLLNARLVVDGDLLTVPGGAVKLAGGAEYLHEQLQSQKGAMVRGFEDSGYPGLSLPANLPGNPLSLIQPPVAPLPVANLKREVKAVFGELVIPVFGKSNVRPGMAELTLSASARYDHYSDAGGTFNPRFGVTYRPLEWIRLRGSWSRSFVAPSLADDARANPTTFSWLSGNAFAIFSPPPDLVANGTWPAPAPGQNFIALILGSVPDIRPQKAKTLSLGADIEPPFVPGLNLALTYWKIDLEDTIVVPPITQRNYWTYLGQLITVNPVQTSIGGALTIADSINNTPCAPLPGCLYAILDGRKRNLGSFRLDGLDFAATYNRATGFGSIDLAVDTVYELGRKQRPLAGAPFVDFLAANFSRLKLRASMGAQIGKLRAQATLYHTAGYRLDPPAGLAPQQTSVSSFDVMNLFFKYDAPGDARSRTSC